MATEGRTTVQLSLKNLYRLLTVKDYPVYSTGILRRKNKKGLTLVRFWDEYLSYEWRNTVHGRLIWRISGSRNRYHSEICNRRADFPLYEVYIQEVLDGLTAESFGKQLWLFEKFLTEREYDHSVFIIKLKEFLLEAEKEDPWLSKDCAKLLLSWVSDVEKNRKKLPERFQAGWLLTMLSLHAMAGDQMDTEKMRELRKRKDLAPELLWRKLEQEQEKRQPVFLTSRNSELCVAPLEGEHFFGREEELYDLKEMLENGGKFLLTGLGGIGKTELLRQLLIWCERERKARKIAVVQYTGSLSDSLNRSFFELKAADQEVRFHECLYRLSGKKTVLFLDNVDHTEEEDPGLLELKELSCTVFVSSRIKKLEGFRNFSVGTPRKSALGLIFQDNYERTLNMEERENLNQLLEKKLFQHPLTLWLLGKAAGARLWTLEELERELETAWAETAGDAGLRDMYRRLYQLSGATAAGEKLVRIFAILPYRKITRTFTKMFFQGFLKKGELLAEELGKLTGLGWLEDTGDGYRMHPVIAESIRMKAPLEEEFLPFWERAEKCFFDGQPGAAEDPAMEELAWMIWNAVSSISGEVSDRLVGLGLKALFYMRSRYRAGEKLQSLIERCPELSDEHLFMVRSLQLEFMTEFGDYGKQFAFYMEKGLLSEEQLLNALTNYGQRLLASGKLTETETLVSEVFQWTDSLTFRVYGEFLLGQCCYYRTKFPAAIAVFEKAIWLILCRKSASRAEEENIRIQRAVDEGLGEFLGDILYMKGMTHLGIGERKEADQSLAVLEEVVKALGNPPTLLLCLEQLRGQAASCRGEAEEALTFMERHKRMVEEFAGKNHINYLAACGELGTAYNRVGNRKKALENQLLMREGLLKTAYDQGNTLSLADNNIGVTCIDDGRPEEAVIYLTEAYQLAEEKNLGEIACAEPAWNLARAYRLLGDEEKEKKFLTKALQGFRNNYAPEHPKRLAAEKREQELNEKRD